MRSKMMLMATVAVIVASLMAAAPANAQERGCMPVRLLIQTNLDLARPAPDTGWAGIVRGLINDSIPLNGKLYSPPGIPPPTKITGQVGHETMRLVFDFGAVGKFVNVASVDIVLYNPKVSPHFTFPPDLAFGRTMSTSKVEPDIAISSGMFVGARGNISITGVFVVNGLPPFDMGIWNAEVSGSLCDVAVPQP